MAFDPMSGPFRGQRPPGMDSGKSRRPAGRFIQIDGRHAVSFRKQPTNFGNESSASEFDPLAPDFAHQRRTLGVRAGLIGHGMHNHAGLINHGAFQTRHPP